MKTLVLIAAASCFIFCAGCAPVPAYEELEAEAETTGDWSLVERYERMQALRDQRDGASCASRQFLYCENYTSGERCACMQSDTLRSFMPSN